MKALEPRKPSKLEPISRSTNLPKEKPAFARKNTERKKVPPTIEALTSKTKESHRSETGAIDDEQAKKERKNLAEIHKRIRTEKQTNGRVITVDEAKKLI